MSATKCRYNCKKGKVFMESLGRLVDCPECRNIALVLDKPEDNGISIFDKLDIPLAYKNFGTAGQDLFNTQGLQAFSQNSINEVANMFERINGDIYAGKVTSISAYFFASNFVDTKRFVYGAQKMALEKNLQVTPYISANTLYGLQRVGDYSLTSLKDIKNRDGELKDVHPDLIHAVDGYRLVQRTDLTYYDYIHADVCFIEATANTTEKGWTAIADLLGERSKQGLPTFIMGYWGTKTSGAGKGLRFLLAPEGSTLRLDLLVPYELKSRSSQGNDEANLSRAVDYGTSKSSVTAGVSIHSIMG